LLLVDCIRVNWVNPFNNFNAHGSRNNL
jgi:hypothetical protein